MIKVNVKLDVRGLERDIAKMRRDVIPKIMARGLNRTIDGVRAETVRTLSKLTSIKQAEIRSRLFVTGATPNKLWAELGVLPYAPNLNKFRATRNRQGVAATAWGQRKTYRGGFTTPEGTVVARVGKQRGPLKPLFGPSLPRTFLREPVIARLTAVANQRWRSEVEREMARRLRASL